MPSFRPTEPDCQERIETHDRHRHLASDGRSGDLLPRQAVPGLSPVFTTERSTAIDVTTHAGRTPVDDRPIGSNDASSRLITRRQRKPSQSPREMTFLTCAPSSEDSNRAGCGPGHLTSTRRRRSGCGPAPFVVELRTAELWGLHRDVDAEIRMAAGGASCAAYRHPRCAQ